MKPIELLKQHCEFNEPTDCYVLIAVSRKKDTPDITNSTEIVFRDVIKDFNDIDKKYLKMKSSIVNYKDVNGRPFPFYLYVMLNPGNARKAMIEMLDRILKWLAREDPSNQTQQNQLSEHYKRLYAEFYSSLMIPKCRGSKKYFMIDYDKKEDFEYFEKILRKYTEVYLIQPTRHGYHIKCKPFDRRDFLQEFGNTDYFEIKTDSLFFVEYVQNES